MTELDVARSRADEAADWAAKAWERAGEAVGFAAYDRWVRKAREWEGVMKSWDAAVSALEGKP